MSEQENIRIARKSIDDLNKHDVNAVDQYWDKNIRIEAPGMPAVMNIPQGKKYTQGFFDAFPDLHFDLRDVVAQGDKVVITWSAHGTHKGNLVGPDQTTTIPPTNQKATVPGCTILEIKNNMVTSQQIYWDMVTLLTQLGVRVDQSMMSRR